METLLKSVNNRELWGKKMFSRNELGLSCSSNGKESACNSGDPGSIPKSGRALGEENGTPLQ